MSKTNIESFSEEEDKNGKKKNDVLVKFLWKIVI